MHHMQFRKCGAPDDGSNDVSSIDLPSENLIFISVGSVSRELQRCMLKYEFWLVTISYDILRTRPHVNGLCVVFPDKIYNGARNCRQFHMSRALQAETLFLIDFS